MAEQFWFRLDNEADADTVERKLAGLKVAQERAFFAKRDGCGIFVSCQIHHPLPENASLRVEQSDRSVPFFDMLYPMETGKSGMHHPDGMLWIRHPGRTHQVHQERVPLLAVAPTLLDLLEIEKPKYMRGESLLRNVSGRPSSGREEESAERRSA
jgi:hypothetical protein